MFRLLDDDEMVSDGPPAQSSKQSEIITNPSKQLIIHDQMIIHYRNMIQSGEMRLIEVGTLRRLKYVKDVSITYTTTLLESQSRQLQSSDLIPNVYEGGFKLWECSIDLSEFLLSNNFCGLNSTHRVLELGCGHGLPGIAASVSGAVVDFQDYNQEALEQVTVPCLIGNLGNVPKESRFFSGDWADLAACLNCQYDMILTADTLYNVASYERLISLFRTCLKVGGKVLIATKVLYFGVGGGVTEFMNAVEKFGCRDVFQMTTLARLENGMSNTRVIIELTKRMN